ncbi:MAG: polyphosphate polymerase domain-containing protein [Bacillus sp. (in: Bacteria)]|nr:polyphosphate polymerase domain-containing protein [Bacillus sp. (in: firmicutes)]MCM1425393.1 polyphosphate polymerase domain-containing protein [Eubacterium sp.]
MDFRHEWKHEINLSDMITLRHRLQTVMQPDEHSIDGRYEIRSLYFDNLADKALREKLDGVNIREKFRMRYYNGDISFIHLEKKSKRGSLGNKESAHISKEEAQAVIDGRCGWMIRDERPLVQELYRKMTMQGLRPKTIVDYTREPYIYPPGNVRVTIDYNIRSGLSHTDFLDRECPMVPVVDSPIILEVKWDNWLPDIIRDAIQLKDCHTIAFSKYAACRAYD